MENVIIYQQKNYKGKWGAINAYIPKNKEDYIRAIKASQNKNINICDVINANDMQEIEKTMQQYYYLEETKNEQREIYDAR